MNVVAIAALSGIISTLVAVCGFYVTAKKFSLSERERAVIAARLPLEREIQDLKDELENLRRTHDQALDNLRRSYETRYQMQQRENEYLRQRIDTLTDELRGRGK